MKLKDIKTGTKIRREGVTLMVTEVGNVDNHIETNEKTWCIILETDKEGLKDLVGYVIDFTGCNEDEVEIVE